MKAAAATVTTTIIADSLDIGMIDAAAARAIKCAAGPIRLPEGYPGPKGYGLLHIESNKKRMRQIREIGFKTAREFVVEIAKHWMIVMQGENYRLILVHEIRGYGLRIVVSPTTHKGIRCWSVITAFPGRTVGKQPVLYKKA